jgi:pyruvate dehydrogenase E2 component (dihydrolipoamide acetyltransferase)
LYEQPHVNAVWNNGKINEIPEVSVGIATAIGEGLIVPVISNADHLSLLEIAKQRSVLVEKARAGKLTLRDLEGGTFTLSNLGMYGIDLFQAIINPPQAAILAIGRIKDKPVVIDGDITIRPMMFVSLSSDHRILDGVTAAKFLNRVTELLENPMELLLSGG